MALPPCITDLPTNEENQVPDGGTTNCADNPGKAAYDNEVRQIAQSDCLFHFHNLTFFVRAAGRSPLPKLSYQDRNYHRAEKMTKKMLDAGLITSEEHDRILAEVRKIFVPFLAELL